MNFAHLVGTALLSLVIASCTTSSGGSGGGGGATTTTSTTTESTTTSGSGGAASCATTGCGAGEFCQFYFASCADMDWHSFPYLGRCVARPDTCNGDYTPVCGCDGKVYGNECSANAAGVDLGASKCAASLTPEKRIACGPVYCDPGATYCRIGYGDMGDTFWNCEPLPAACQGAPTADCACLDPLQNGATCTVVEGNGASGLQVEMSFI